MCLHLNSRPGSTVRRRTNRRGRASRVADGPWSDGDLLPWRDSAANNGSLGDRPVGLSALFRTCRRSLNFFFSLLVSNEVPRFRKKTLSPFLRSSCCLWDRLSKRPKGVRAAFFRSNKRRARRMFQAKLKTGVCSWFFTPPKKKRGLRVAVSDEPVPLYRCRLRLSPGS